jgi:hypothetical protein
MTRRKREIVRLTNERDFPHLVELALPPERTYMLALPDHRETSAQWLRAAELLLAQADEVIE